MCLVLLRVEAVEICAYSRNTGRTYEEAEKLPIFVEVPRRSHAGAKQPRDSIHKLETMGHARKDYKRRKPGPPAKSQSPVALALYGVARCSTQLRFSVHSFGRTPKEAELPGIVFPVRGWMVCPFTGHVARHPFCGAIG